MNVRTQRICNIVQGDHAVSGDPAVVITTILGSCVSACIQDPVAGIGGANHFLLADPGNGPIDIRYAAAAMEVLINSLLRAGAQKHRLEAKLFGGARLMPKLPDIGRDNARAAAQFLDAEGIPVVASDLGGVQARKLRFIPSTGRVQIQRLAEANLTSIEAPRQPKAPGIELFE